MRILMQINLTTSQNVGCRNVNCGMTVGETNIIEKVFFKPVLFVHVFGIIIPNTAQFTFL